MREVFTGASYSIYTPNETFPLPSFTISGTIYQGYAIIYQPYPIPKINIPNLANSDATILFVATSVWTGTSFTPISPMPVYSSMIETSNFSNKLRIDDKPILLSPIFQIIGELGISVSFINSSSLIRVS